jgi:hypothetical protein
MAGLVPAIHVLLVAIGVRKTWMPATSAGMTMERLRYYRRPRAKRRGFVISAIR